MTEPHVHPDDDLLARYADGGLLEARRAEVEAHVAACDDCREVVAALARTGVVPQPVLASRSRWLRTPGWLLAAAALLVAGIGAFVLLREKPGTPPAPDTDARLVAAAAELARYSPGMFEGFRPLNAAERRRPEADPLRGGLSLLLPSGTSLAVRPDFQWTSVAGAKSYQVKLLDEDGLTVLEQRITGTTLPGTDLPKDLARGRDYLWKVTALGVQPRAEGTKAFFVARSETVESFASARASILALAADRPRDLLLAHYAWRQRLLPEALEAARRHVAAHPQDRVGLETLEGLLADVGPGSHSLR